MDKLLDLRDYNAIVSQTVDHLDVELLLDFILYVRMPSFYVRGVVLLAVATAQQQPFELRRSGCQPQSQEADVQTDIQDSCCTQLSIYN